MGQKVAVAIIHGIGVPDPRFAEGMIAELRERIAGHLAGQSAAPAEEIVFEPVLWAPVLQGKENLLWEKLKIADSLSFHTLRRFMIDFAADALAYQPTPHDMGVYIGVHRVVAQALKSLAAKAGPKAPLCVIAHSLGTVIASNYLYDLQVYPRKRLIHAAVRKAMGKSPLDKGETLTSVYTLGSPLALWSLRYDDFGRPIDVPSPKLQRHYPGLKGEWNNYYDAQDIIGFPLKPINADYFHRITEDKAVSVGNLLTGWNPASHTQYWTDNDITRPIAEGIVRVWRQANALTAGG